MLQFAKIQGRIPYIVAGLGVTLTYTAISMSIGFILAVLLAAAKSSSVKPLRFLGTVYTSWFRGTPLILQLALVYFGLPQITQSLRPEWHVTLSAFQAGIITFSLNSSAYLSEIIRAGIKAVDAGQVEAAQSLGVPYARVMQHIVLPQAIKKMLPSLLNEFIDLLKETALLSTIGEADLLRRANVVAASSYLYFEPLLVAGLCYYVIANFLTYLAHRLETYLARYS